MLSGVACCMPRRVPPARTHQQQIMLRSQCVGVAFVGQGCIMQRDERMRLCNESRPSCSVSVRLSAHTHSRAATHIPGCTNPLPGPTSPNKSRNPLTSRARHGLCLSAAISTNQHRHRQKRSRGPLLPVPYRQRTEQTRRTLGESRGKKSACAEAGQRHQLQARQRSWMG